MVTKRGKKFVLVTILSVLIFTIISAGAYGAVKSLTKNIKATYRNIQIYAYGKKLSNGVEPFILTEQGVTMVPLRLVSEALGQKVIWPLL